MQARRQSNSEVEGKISRYSASEKSPRWTAHTWAGGAATGVRVQNEPGPLRLPAAESDLPGQPGEAGQPRPRALLGEEVCVGERSLVRPHP